MSRTDAGISRASAVLSRSRSSSDTLGQSTSPSSIGAPVNPVGWRLSALRWRSGLPPRVFVQQGAFSQRGALLVTDVPPAALVRIRPIFTVGRKCCEAHYYVFPRLRLRTDDHVNMTFPEGHPDGARAGVFNVQRSLGVAVGFIHVQLVSLVPELFGETGIPGGGVAEEIVRSYGLPVIHGEASL